MRKEFFQHVGLLLESWRFVIASRMYPVGYRTRTLNTVLHRDESRVQTGRAARNDSGRRDIVERERIFSRHCEPPHAAWQSILLNSRMDCFSLFTPPVQFASSILISSGEYAITRFRPRDFDL